MELKSRCHYHFASFEEAGPFISIDGLEFPADWGEFFQWNEGGHIDHPFDAKESAESYMKERRNYPSPGAQMYYNPVDII